MLALKRGTGIRLVPSYLGVRGEVPHPPGGTRPINANLSMSPANECQKISNRECRISKIFPHFCGSIFHVRYSTSDLGACPRIRRGRAHGACTASARREEEAMSMHIVDDEQRSDRRATPMRPSGSGLEGASASLALLDDVH